ncbi:hypothetical protein G7Y89_g9256 [Cudoniella acicularis]|uniref:Uncharacterized protein n=1 Tax=Cudoniella acicularis TaxID=354080 RepID=A0A8H4RH81_9HELO|nr:hypothetical protein G7Y89_g9256 [Cudoniella acicularis]
MDGTVGIFRSGTLLSGGDGERRRHSQRQPSAECNFYSSLLGLAGHLGLQALATDLDIMGFLHLPPTTASPLAGGPSYQVGLLQVGSSQLQVSRVDHGEAKSVDLASATTHKPPSDAVLVPRASETVPFVHHAMIAIGALSKVFKESRDFYSPSSGGRSNTHLMQEFEYALREYRKALQVVKAAMTHGYQDMKHVLLASLLAFCIETLQGHQGPACALALKTLTLLESRKIDYSITGFSTRAASLEAPLYSTRFSSDNPDLFVATRTTSLIDTYRNSTISATILQLQAKMNLVSLAGISFTTEISYDALLPEFCEIIKLASSIHPELIASSQNNVLYHFDVSVLPALYVVASKCRDRPIRD